MAILLFSRSVKTAYLHTHFFAFCQFCRIISSRIDSFTQGSFFILARRDLSAVLMCKKELRICALQCG